MIVTVLFANGVERQWRTVKQANVVGDQLKLWDKYDKLLVTVNLNNVAFYSQDDV